jgi:hypothetical protein
MRVSPQPLETDVDELLRLLDEQIELLGVRKSQLERLSSGLVEHDDAGVEALLEEMERAAVLQAAADSRLARQRERLAGQLGWEVGQTRLSRLIGLVDPERGRALEQRRRHIGLLAKQVTRQHMETTFFLCECARINEMMLRALRPATAPVLTYGARASSQRWQGQGGLFSAEM